MGMEQDLKSLSQSQADLRQSSAQWQTKFRAERAAREQEIDKPEIFQIRQASGSRQTRS
jgi:hypothetical protein